MEQPRYVQHISKTGPIEEVVSHLSQYWVVNRINGATLDQILLNKGDYVLVEKPKARTNIGFEVREDGQTLTNPWNGTVIARASDGYRFMYNGQLILQKLA